MRVMLLAFLTIAAVAVGANMALHEAGFSSQDQNTGDAVRIE